MPNPEEARKTIRAKIKALRQSDKSPPAVSLDKVYATLKTGRSVYLVFKNNAERRSFQQRILQDAVAALNQEPRGGLPKGALAGERVFQWENGAEIAFSTSAPGDINGKLFMEVKPPNTEIWTPQIPESWNKKKK